MIVVAIHPFLVHLLIAGCVLYLLALGPRPIRKHFSGLLRPLSAFLTVLFPLVLLAGLLARHRVLDHIPAAASAIRFHLWTGVLMVLLWWPFVWKTSRCPSGGDPFPPLHPMKLVLMATALAVSATAGGWLVYGPHAIPFPLR